MNLSFKPLRVGMFLQQVFNSLCDAGLAAVFPSVAAIAKIEYNKHWDQEVFQSQDPLGNHRSRQLFFHSSLCQNDMYGQIIKKTNIKEFAVIGHLGLGQHESNTAKLPLITSTES